MRGSKTLTLGDVIEIIALARVPLGETSADRLIIERIDGYVEKGYILTKDAEREIAKHRNNIKPKALQGVPE